MLKRRHQPLNSLSCFYDDCAYTVRRGCWAAQNFSTETSFTLQTPLRHTIIPTVLCNCVWDLTLGNVDFHTDATATSRLNSCSQQVSPPQCNLASALLTNALRGTRPPDRGRSIIVSQFLFNSFCRAPCRLRWALEHVQTLHNILRV